LITWYAIFHDPINREKYTLNLKREFPRIPFYPDFWKWADWGETLMALHIGFESVVPWPLRANRCAGGLITQGGACTQSAAPGE